MKRTSLAVALSATVAGCTTMWDYVRSRPLEPLPVHRGMEAKEQCMHCHTAAVAGAPAVPHPQYERCAMCHETAAIATP